MTGGAVDPSTGGWAHGAAPGEAAWCERTNSPKLGRMARLTITLPEVSAHTIGQFFFHLEVATAILAEAYISFLGMGVQPPTATWGNMLNEAYNHLEGAPWMWFFPGTLILLTVMAINFLGDGLRDAFDPRSLSGRSR